MEQFNEQGDKGQTLKELKRCLAKFDTDKMNFEAILTTTNTKIRVTTIFSSLNFQLYIYTTLILVTTIGYNRE